jgi:formamidopyrimidine-DNA glycosylase
MPELPEVECLRRSLEPHLVGRTVSRAVLKRRDICEVFAPSGRRRASPADLLEGRTIARLDRRGKQLAIIADDGAVLSVHLGMTGQLLFTPSPMGGASGRDGRTPAITEARSHVHAQWELTESGSPVGRLMFRDARRFGGLWTFPSTESHLAHRWSALGPDALAITPEQLAPGLRDSRRHIKAALLDQGVLAGVGNIYADEALFRAGIRPKRLTCRLSAAEVEVLTAAIHSVLHSSIQTGGSTLRDYRDANGLAGSSQLTHAVYGRGGEACVGCGGRLREAQVAQRTTVWCAHCQQ